MTKSPSYVTIAVLLGVALMFIPLALFTIESRKGAELSRGQPSPQLLTNTFKESSLDSERRAGMTPNYPLDAISVGSMFTLSLIFAFIVSSRWKKKVV